jgi:predicted dinucleotide-binding enzyme
VTIAIVGGTGPEGSGLALRWAQAGETVVIGSRDPQRASAIAVEIQKQTGGRVSGAENTTACQSAEIIVLTIPFEAVVAAFHNVSADLVKQSGPVDCDVIVCSDDKKAARTVRELARKIPGVRALDGGKLENARIVEQITALLIGFNIRHKGHSGLRITGLPSEAYDI